MGSYTFRWEHPADEVYVTGTFDNWSKSVKLDKKDFVHEKTVDLPTIGDKIFYKFVADGDWKYDHTGKTEADHEGNLNNVLYPADLGPYSAQYNASSVAPGATTTGLAGAQPPEGQVLPQADPQHLPGAFPETPAALDNQQFSVNPIPGTSAVSNPIQLAPGEPVPHFSTIHNNTISSNVRDDPDLVAADAAKSPETEQTFGVSPLPATSGIGNPIQLTPGEAVPESNKLSGNTINSNVRLDKESYENSNTTGTTIPGGAEVAAGATAVGAGLLGGAAYLGDKAKGLIPESSMPMGEDTPASIANENVGPHISSVAPTSTTNELAGRVPLEPRSRDADANISSVAPTSTTNTLAGSVPLETSSAPAVVTESQEKAHVDPEASAVPSAVEDKKDMESELQSKVPEAPATSESGLTTENVVGMAAGGIAAAGAAAAGTALSFKDRFFGAGVASGTDDWTTSATTPPATESATAPSLVSESQEQANVGPEASANPVAVEEKREVETELQSKVPEAPATSESGLTAGNAVGTATGGIAAAGASAAGTAYALKDRIWGTGTTTSTTGTAAGSAATPAIVTESQSQAHVDPEASANPIAVQEKNEVENELQSKVSETPATTESTAPSSTGSSNLLVAAGVPATSSTGPAWTGGAPPTSTNATEVSKDVAAGEIPTTTSTNTPSTTGPVTSPSTGREDSTTAGIAGGIAAAGTAVAGTAYALREKTTSATGRDPVSVLPQSVQDSINAMDKKAGKNPIGANSTGLGQTTATSVPEEVVASQKAAHVDPEASASPVMVGEKSAVEKELLSKVATTQESGAPAPSSTAALSATAPTSSASGAPQLGNPVADVKPLAMDGTSIPGLSGLNATASTPAVSAITSSTARPEVSRDVSPMTKPTTSSQTQPIVTTGVDSAQAPAQSGKPVGTPRKGLSENASPTRRSSMLGRFKGTPESQKTTDSATPGSSGTDKKDKRKSFFGRLKEKIHKSDN